MPATPAAATTATPLPQPTSARTPIQSDTVAAITSTFTPNGNSSQDVSQSMYSSFPTVTPGNQPHPFPAASTFTFIPDLYNLISRLRLLEGTPQYRGQGSTDGSISRAATQSPLLSRDSGPATKTDPDLEPAADSRPDQKATSKVADETIGTDKAVIPTSLGSSSKPVDETNNKSWALDVKDLPENVYVIKQAIQNAREVVATLPDIHRTTREQEIEIDHLRQLINGLKKRAGELADLAVQNGDAVHGTPQQQEDVVMQGVEGAG